MKPLALGVFGVMVIWTLAMACLTPEQAGPGTRPLIWTSDDNPQRTEQVALFNQLSQPLSVKLDPANQGMEKVIVQSMGGVGPDLFDCRDGAQLSSYVQAGIAWDVTEELSRMGISLQRDTWPAMHPNCLWEGRTYGLPTNIAPNALWVHAEILQSKGINLPTGPWKWEEFIPIAKALTVRKEGKVQQYGFLFDWYNWPHFFRGQGAEVFNREGTRCIVDSPEALRAVQLMHDLVYLHEVSPTPVEEAGMASRGGWGSGTINLFGAKRAATALGGRWWLVNLKQFEGLNLNVYESPHGSHRRFSALGRATLINRSSPRREEALRFLAYLASEPYARLIDRQADGSPAFKAHTGRPLAKPEAGHEVWSEAVRHAVPDWTSPYVSGYVVSRIMGEQLDLVKSGSKSPREAMKTAARQINDGIAKAVREDPVVRRRYEEAMKRVQQ
jgi:multiple sugar transport system substrate-binding protein